MGSVIYAVFMYSSTLKLWIYTVHNTQIL